VWIGSRPGGAPAASTLPVRSRCARSCSTAGRWPATATACRCSTGCAIGARTTRFLFAFDLLELNGRDRRREPIEVRKGELGKLLRWSAQIGL
jgi:hypothetical protein